MEKINTAIVVVLVFLGLVGMVMDLSPYISSFYDAYQIAIELYLFIFCAFLVLKRLLFYRVQGNGEVVQLKERSHRYNTLILQGIVLVLFHGLYLKIYSDWLTFDSVMIGVLLLYYIGQVLANSNPSIYVDARAFAFDDYFVEEWKWNDMEQISVEKEKLTVQGKEKNFELALDAIDEMDAQSLSREVDASILDGSFATENASTTLISAVKSYATFYGISLKLPK